MATYGLQYDGSNDKGDLTNIINLTGDFKVRVKFTYSNDSIIQGITGNKSTSSNIVRLNTSGASVLIRLSGATSTLTFSSALVQGNDYTLIMKRVSGVVDITDENNVSVVTSTYSTSNAFSVDCLGYRNNTDLSDMLFHDFNIEDNGVTVLNLENTTGTGNSWLDTSGSNDLDLVGFPTDDSQWVLLSGGGGSVTVTGTTPSFNYSSIAASIDLTGSIDVTGQTANYTYSAANGAIDLTGDILITGATASYNYQSINGAVDLTGEITVLGATPNQSYSSVSGIIELGAVISVVGLTPNYNYQGIAGEVSLNGEILVSGETPSYSYSAIKGFITTGEAQVIGTVTSSFASDVYSSGFKPSTITVNFKS